MIKFTLKKKDAKRIANLVAARHAAKQEEINSLKKACGCSISSSNTEFFTALRIAKSITKVVVLERIECRGDEYSGGHYYELPKVLEEGVHYLGDKHDYWRGCSSRDQEILFNDEGNWAWWSHTGDYLDEQVNYGISFYNILKYLGKID